MKRSWLTAGIAVLAVVGAVLGVSIASAQTQAAWTDRAYSKAAITAGTWVTPPAGNTCTAVDVSGRAVTCAVSGIRFDVWGSAGDQYRNYYIDFNAPGAKTIKFSVDLSTATGTATTWSWANAGIGSGAQFAGTSGWTCASLPRVTGQANDWYSTVFFPAYENRTGKSVMCS